MNLIKSEHLWLSHWTIDSIGFVIILFLGIFFIIDISLIIKWMSKVKMCNPNVFVWKLIENWIVNRKTNTTEPVDCHLGINTINIYLRKQSLAKFVKFSRQV